MEEAEKDMGDLETHSAHSDPGQTDSPHMKPVRDKVKSVAKDYHVDHTSHWILMP